MRTFVCTTEVPTAYKKMAAPMDLNVPFDEESILLQKISLLQKLGYEAVAVNNNILEPLEPSGKKKKGQNKVEVKSPNEILIKEDVLKTKLGVTRRPFKQYSRISMVLTNTGQALAVDSKQVQAYDIVAVHPTSEETFGQACKQLKVDIITLNVTESLSFHLKRPTINAAIERGIHFEIQYSNALRDKSMRKHLISNASKLVFWCKGKNVIITSGCMKPIELRGPHDVANLGLLFNLSESQTKDAIRRNCHAVLKHTEARRIVRSVLTVSKTDQVPVEDNWILDKCSAEKESRLEDDDSSGYSEEDSDIEPDVKRKKITKNGLLSEDIHSGSPIKRMKTEDT